MIGKLVAVRVDDLGDCIEVYGLVAQQKNRKVAWHFQVRHKEAKLIPEKVEQMEKDRKMFQVP